MKHFRQIVRCLIFDHCILEALCDSVLENVLFAFKLVHSQIDVGFHVPEVAKCSSTEVGSPNRAQIQKQAGRKRNRHLNRLLFELFVVQSCKRSE